LGFSDNVQEELLEFDENGELVEIIRGAAVETKDLASDARSFQPGAIKSNLYEMSDSASIAASSAVG
jgi:hypothetical protein